MIDHHEARVWADHHCAYSGWAAEAAHAVGEAFRVLARIQYQQPWACQRQRQRCARP